MFSKSIKKLPKQKEFALQPEEFLRDIEAISKDEDERRKLYQCIDCKVPASDPKLSKIEGFLRDNEELETLVDDLRTKCEGLKKEQMTLEQHEAAITQLLIE